MKLLGGNVRGRHLSRNVGSTVANSDNMADSVAQKSLPRQKTGSKKRIIGIVFLLLLAAGSSVFLYVRTALSTRPPVKSDPRPQRVASDHTRVHDEPVIQSPDDPVEDIVAINVRDTSVYTFLVLATDNSGGNTDVIIVVSFDTTDNTLSVVNIPRDTLVNVSWSVKKANSIYASMRQRHGWEDSALSDGMDATIEVFADLLGFEVDYWALVDMRAFVALVDAIDGVDFDIPVNMYYDDSAGGLSINYSKGTQRLYGKQALEVLRYRSSYGDVGRINTQQSFLMAAAQQILARSSSLSVMDLAKIIIDYVRTDVDLSSLIWFGNQFIKLNSSSIEFKTMPGNYNDWISGGSYVTLYLEEWLEIVNEFLNPFAQDITPQDVSIMTRGENGYIYVTDGNRQGDASWGAGNVGTSASNGAPSSSGSGNSLSNPTGSSSPPASSTSTDNHSPTDNGSQTSTDLQPGIAGAGVPDDIGDNQALDGFADGTDGDGVPNSTNLNTSDDDSDLDSDNSEGAQTMHGDIPSDEGPGAGTGESPNDETSPSENQADAPTGIIENDPVANAPSLEEDNG